MARATLAAHGSRPLPKACSRSRPPGAAKAGMARERDCSSQVSSTRPDNHGRALAPTTFDAEEGHRHTVTPSRRSDSQHHPIPDSGTRRPRRDDRAASLPPPTTPERQGPTDSVGGPLRKIEARGPDRSKLPHPLPRRAE